MERERVAQGTQKYKFCPHCGQPLEMKKEVPYVGKRGGAAIYRITFDPVEVECSSRAAAEEAAQEAFWDVDRKFSGYSAACNRIDQNRFSDLHILGP